MFAKRKADDEPQGPSAKKARTDEQTSVIVTGPIDHTSGPDVKNAFSRFGTVTSVYICEKGMGYVRFQHPGAVEVALKAQQAELPNGLLVKAIQCGKTQKPQGGRSFEHRFGWKAQEAVDEETVLSGLRKHSSLSDQIAELCNLVLLDEEEVQSRRRYCSELRSLLARYFPKCSMAVFGSSANGCGAKGCDLDLYLDFGCNQPAEASGDRDGKKRMQPPSVHKVATSRAACETLWRMPARAKLQFVRKVLWHHRRKALATCAFINARCPIVRFEDIQTGLKCDINATMRTSVVNTDLLKTYIRAHPAVRPLVVAARRWFVACGLLDSQRRLFSSYAVYALVCCHLQRTKPPVLPTMEHLAELHAQFGGRPETADGFRCEFLQDLALLPRSKNAGNLGNLFRGLFEFLLEIDFEKEVVVLRNATLVPREVFYEQLQRTPHFEAFNDGPMVMQDPIDLSRNVTRQIAPETLSLLLENARDAVRAIRRGAGLSVLLTIEQRKPDDLEKRHCFTLSLSAKGSACFDGDAGEWANEVCDLMLQLFVAHRIEFDVAVRNYASGREGKESVPIRSSPRSVVETAKSLPAKAPDGVQEEGVEAAVMLRLTGRLMRAIWEGRNKLSRLMNVEDPLEKENSVSDSLWEGATSVVVDFGFEASKADPSYTSVHLSFFPLGDGCEHFTQMCEGLFGRDRVSEIVNYHTQNV